MDDEPLQLAPLPSFLFFIYFLLVHHFLRVSLGVIIIIIIFSSPPLCSTIAKFDLRRRRRGKKNAD